MFKELKEIKRTRSEQIEKLNKEIQILKKGTNRKSETKKNEQRIKEVCCKYPSPVEPQNMFSLFNNEFLANKNHSTMPFPTYQKMGQWPPPHNALKGALIGTTFLKYNLYYLAKSIKILETFE